MTTPATTSGGYPKSAPTTASFDHGRPNSPIEHIDADIDVIAFALANASPDEKAEIFVAFRLICVECLTLRGDLDEESISLMADALGVRLAAPIRELEDASGNA
jgi:hypothetical protein